MQHVSKAVAWLKAQVPPTNMVCSEGRTVAGPAAVVHELRSWWSNLWLSTSHQDPNHLCEQASTIWHRAGRNARVQPVHSLTVHAFRQALKQMRGKATGPDGGEVETLARLPDNCIQKLVQLLCTIEKCAEWPEALLCWKIIFLPKKMAR